jgi:predicted  nucleic acid-binding Zn-ribbon protein
MINREEISPLIALQRALSDYDAIHEQLLKIPEELEKLDTQLNGIRERNSQVHMNLDQSRKRCREAERNLQDLQLALERFNKQIYDVKSNKEYSAMIAEIAAIKGKINDTETEILVAMDELEMLTAEATIADDLLGKEEGEVRQHKTELEAQQDMLKKQLDEARINLDNARKMVPSDLMSEFDRIHSFTGSTVVAPATKRGENFACGGCFMKITPHIMTELRKGNISQCEACARFIYWCEDES